MVEDDTESIEVPLTQNPLSPDQLHALERSIDPLKHCDDHGISLYTVTHMFIEGCT